MDVEGPPTKSVNGISDKDEFWYQWILKYSFSELVGIGAAVIICWLLLSQVSDAVNHSPSFVTPLIIGISGLAEGLIIGYLQWKSLSKLLVDLGKEVWIISSVISMIIGWLLFIPPAIFFISFFIDFSLEKEYYTVVYTAVTGMLFGSIIGVGQYFVLKRFYRKSMAWVLANAIGWMLSFLIVYLSLAVMKHIQSAAVNVLLMIMACVLSGSVQGVVSGLALRSIMSIRKYT